jgi:hypothetical protein
MRWVGGVAHVPGIARHTPRSQWLLLAPVCS